MSHGLGLSPFLDGRAESRASGKFACDQDLTQAHAGGRSAFEIEKLNRPVWAASGSSSSCAAAAWTRAQVGTLPTIPIRRPAPAARDVEARAFTGKFGEIRGPNVASGGNLGGPVHSSAVDAQASNELEAPLVWLCYAARSCKSRTMSVTRDLWLPPRCHDTVRSGSS